MKPIYYTKACICMENGVGFDVSEWESTRGSETQELTKEKSCMSSRLILHQGRLGTYLSQQGEPGEG